MNVRHVETPRNGRVDTEPQAGAQRSPLGLETLARLLDRVVVDVEHQAQADQLAKIGNDVGDQLRQPRVAFAHQSRSVGAVFNILQLADEDAL